jgi:protein AroM
MSRKIGMVTIGQSPRTDIEPIFQKYLPDAQIVQAGALDGLEKAEIESTLFPSDGDYVLTTRLRSGDSVVLARHKMEDLLQQKIFALEDAGCDPILVLCTGVFDHITTKKSLLVEPDRVIPPAVAAVIGKKQLGLIVPLEEQVTSLEEKWVAVGKKPLVAVASPYTGEFADFADAAKELEAAGADVLLLDCMGYDETMKQWVLDSAPLPVILSNAFMVKLVSELV